MHFLRFIIVIALLCSYLSCSDDDPGSLDNGEETISENFPAFSFITEQPEGIVQFVFDESTQVGNLVNLSQTDGISPVIARTYVADNVVGLYVQDVVWLKNLETGSVVMGQNMFSQTDEIFSNWAVNTDDTVYIGFHMGIAFDDFNIFAQNIVADVQEGFAVGNIGQSFMPTFGTNHLAFHNNIGSGSSSLSTLGLINTQDNTNVAFPVLLPGDFVTGVIFGQENDLYVFSTEGRFHRYTLTTLSLIETTPTDFRTFLSGREQLRDNEVYYIQEGASVNVDRLPAIYDLTANENILVDLSIPFQQIQEERLYETLQTTDMQYSFTEEAWIVGYRFTTTTSTGGGVFKVDRSGTILSETQLDVAPDTLVLFE